MKFSVESVQQISKKLRDNLILVKNWAVANKKVSIPAATGVFVVLVAAVLFFTSAADQKAAVAQPDQAAGDQTAGNLAGAIPIPETPLEENAHPEVNSLMTEYFSALADGNLEVVKNLKSYLDPAEEIRIQKKSEFIEKYENIACYTKKGPMENSYLVYTYVDAKFYDIETTAPGLYSYFVCPKEDGSYWIVDGEMDDNFTEYFKVVSAQEDVADLFTRVKVKYAEAVDADTDLKALVDGLPDKIDSSVGEALAQLEESAISENSAEEETATQEQSSEQPRDDSVIQNSEFVMTKEVVNVRSSDSETADKIGKTQKGVILRLLEVKQNGWSKVEFDGKEAFIKSEFLEPSEAPKVVEDPEVQEQAPAQNTSTPSSSDHVTAKTTVNIRASANENGERLGTIYMGEKLEVIMKQADGWTKVKYNGKTGYVKSEFVE